MPVFFSPPAIDTWTKTTRVVLVAMTLTLQQTPDPEQHNNLTNMSKTSQELVNSTSKTGAVLRVLPHAPCT